MRERSSGSADEIGLIGYGRFGRFAAHHLSRRFSVFVADVSRGPIERGLHRATLAKAASRPVVILAVPIGQFQHVLKSIREDVQPGALVLDVCSVKERPLAWMKQLLPRSVEILGTHPLFGPDSAADRLAGRPIILCGGRISESRRRCVLRYLRSLRLQISSMTPSRHDRLMASTLFLTQFIGRGILRTHPPDTAIATQSFLSLSEIAERVGHDTPELFRDMYRYNRFARTIPRKTIREFERLVRGLR